MPVEIKVPQLGESVVEATVGRWLKQAEVDAGEREGLTTDEKAELTRLRREVADLREEKEILKKFAAWSAQEANWTPRRRPEKCCCRRGSRSPGC